MIFSAPERLIYLLPLVALVLLLAWKRRKPSIVHPFLLQLAKRLRPASRWIYLPRALEVLALAVLIPALLSPVLPLARYAVSNEGLDIILVIDLSSSMEEPIDMIGALRRERQGLVVKEKTRLEAVKEAMVQFVQSRQTDRLGVVVFSEEGYVVVPMTTDLPYVTRYLGMVEIAMLAGEGQTAIGEGIWAAMGQTRAQARDGTSGAAGRKGKVIVVLTDGENNTGRDVVQALEAAAASGFRVHFIGVDLERPKDAARVKAAVLATGGQYFDVRKEAEVQQAYFDIDHMEKARFVSTVQVKNLPAYAPFALTALGLLLGSALLRTRARFTEVS